MFCLHISCLHVLFAIDLVDLHGTLLALVLLGIQCLHLQVARQGAGGVGRHQLGEGGGGAERRRDRARRLFHALRHLVVHLADSQGTCRAQLGDIEGAQHTCRENAQGTFNIIIHGTCSENIEGTQPCTCREHIEGFRR